MMPKIEPDTLQNILGVMGMINAGLPSAIRLVMMLKRPDGTFTILDEADKLNAANLAQAQAWLDAHPE
jgi:ABC-type methionine transport system ATPase subunit